MKRPSYKIGEAALMLGVSPDTVRRLADSGKLKTTRAEGGRRQVDAGDLARHMAATTNAQPTPVFIGQSARNRFPGIVTRVVKDRVMAQVEIQAGPFRVVSLMSTEAADELGLAPGVRAVGAVKATNVVVEVPEG